MIRYPADSSVEDTELLAVNPNTFTVRVLVKNAINPVFAPGQSNRLIFSRYEDMNTFSVWSANRDGSNPILLGTASNSLPLSVTDEGKVLLLEKGHLVLKWVDEEKIQIHPLIDVENNLNLTWGILEPIVMEYGEISPLIDFITSPDGQWMGVFDGGQNKLWLVTIDGQLIQNIPIDPNLLERVAISHNIVLDITFSAWSPNSQTLAYNEGYINFTMPRDSWSEVKVATIDGGLPIQVFPGTTTKTRNLNWAPDGQFITFLAETYIDPTGSGTDWYLALADGSNAQLISTSALIGRRDNPWMANNYTLIYSCNSEPSQNNITLDICLINMGSQ